METTVTNQPGHKGAFASTMQGGAIYYTPDITAEKPAVARGLRRDHVQQDRRPRQQLLRRRQQRRLDPDQPRRQVPLPRASRAEVPTATTRAPRRTSSSSTSRSCSPRATRPQCNIDTIDEITAGGAESDCPAVVDTLKAPGGPHWGALDNLELGSDGFYHEGTAKRLAYSNYFVARTGLNGDHRVCLADQADGRQARRSTRSSATSAPARPASTSTATPGPTATGVRRSRTRCCSSPPMTTSSSALVRLVAGLRHRALVVAVSGALRSGRRRQRRAARVGRSRLAGAGPDGRAAPAGTRCSAATSGPGRAVGPAVRARPRAVHGLGRARPARAATSSASTTTGHAHGARSPPGVRRHDGAGPRPRPAPARRRRPLGRGRPARGQGHRARHARSRPPDPVRGRHRPRSAPSRRRWAGRGRARVPRRGHRAALGRRSTAPAAAPPTSSPPPTARRSARRVAPLAERGRRASSPSTATTRLGSRAAASRGAGHRRGRGSRRRRPVDAPAAPGERNALLVLSGWADAAEQLAAVSARSRCAASRSAPTAPGWRRGCYSRGGRLHRRGDRAAGLRHPRRSRPSGTARPWRGTSPDRAHRVRVHRLAAGPAAADRVLLYAASRAAYMPSSGAGHAGARDEVAWFPGGTITPVGDPVP